MLLIGGLAPQTGVKDWSTRRSDELGRLGFANMWSLNGERHREQCPISLDRAVRRLRLITAGCPRRKPASEVGRFDRLESHMLQSVAAVHAIDMCGNKAERVWLL
jgi:hypothetical protein